MNLIFPLLIVGFVVLLVTQSRRQRKEVRATQELQSGLEVGDRVMTTAGLHATVAGLDEDTVDLEVAPGVVTTWSRLVIRQLVEDDEATGDDATGDDATGNDTTGNDTDEHAVAGDVAAAARPGTEAVGEAERLDAGDAPMTSGPTGTADDAGRTSLRKP